MADVKATFTTCATDGTDSGTRGGKDADGESTSGTPSIVFKMRGRDDGRTPGSDYIIWTNTGKAADFAGAGFAGGSPTPIGSLIAGSVVLVGSWPG